MNMFKLASLATFALVACDEAAPVDAGADTTSQLAAEQAPPAGSITLDVDGLLEPGRTLTFRVSGAPANATVTLIRCTCEAQTCHAAIAPI